MSKSIYDKLNLINQETDKIKVMLVNSKQLTAEEATLENIPPAIQAIIEAGGGSIEANPYEELYMQRTANETSMKGLFAYTPASTTLDLSKVNTSKVTDMSYMFADCKVLYLDLSGFDVSNVSNMERMFNYCTSEINIDGWDTSKLTNANNMFNNFTGSIDLSKLDFSSVTNATYMFSNTNTDKINLTGLSFPKATSLTYMFYQAKGTILDLSSWDISNITDFQSLIGFSGYKEVNLANWKTTKVTNMNSIFYYLTILEKLIIPDWDMTNTTNTSSFFYNCSKLNYIDLSRSNDVTIAKIATLVPAKTLAAYGQMIIPADSSQANIEALIAKYWKPVGPRFDITSCKIITELDEIKPGKTTKLYCGNSEPWYGNNDYVEYVSSDETIATIDKETMTITSTGIEGTTEITARIADTQEVISEPKVFVVSETDNYPNVIKFRGTSTPTSYNYIKINGKDVKLSAMNYNSLSGIYTYDVGAPITSIQFNWHTSYANTCTDVVKINTSNVTSMYQMFYRCNNLTSLDLSSFNTSNVDNMEEMFFYCTNLTSLDLSSFNTSNVTNMKYMFFGCDNLTSLDLSSFDTSNVTDMSNMFASCDKLTSIDVSSWDTSNVTNMNYMFEDCYKLTSLDLSSWDVSKVTNFTYTFYNCTALTDFKAPKNINATIDFSSCPNLTHDSLMSIINNLTTKTSTTRLKLGTVNLSKLTDEEKAIATSKKWTLA